MSQHTFEIGLVGAGAISAGAYTGGVIDFMVQALDEWYDAKTKNQKVPPHDVKLSVFSGASAGAITAALATGYLGRINPPSRQRVMRSREKEKTNFLNRGWRGSIFQAFLISGI